MADVSTPGRFKTASQMVEACRRIMALSAPAIGLSVSALGMGSGSMAAQFYYRGQCTAGYGLDGCADEFDDTGTYQGEWTCSQKNDAMRHTAPDGQQCRFNIARIMSCHAMPPKPLGR